MKVTAGEHKLSEAGGILVLLLPENNEILGKSPFFVEHKGKKKSYSLHTWVLVYQV